MTAHYIKERHSPIDGRVLRALDRPPGYFCVQQITRYLHARVQSVASSFGRLSILGDIEFVGTAESAGLTQFKTTTRLYGLKGTPRIVRQAVHAVGNERIAQPNRGFEFRPLNRDPFAHMKLAMLTREGRPA